MVMKSTNAYRHLRVSYILYYITLHYIMLYYIILYYIILYYIILYYIIICTVFLLHDSATLVAFLRAVHYKVYITKTF